MCSRHRIACSAPTDHPPTPIIGSLLTLKHDKIAFKTRKQYESSLSSTLYTNLYYFYTKAAPHQDLLLSLLSCTISTLSLACILPRCQRARGTNIFLFPPTRVRLALTPGSGVNVSCIGLCSQVCRRNVHRRCILHNTNSYCTIYSLCQQECSYLRRMVPPGPTDTDLFMSGGFSMYFGGGSAAVAAVCCSIGQCRPRLKRFTIINASVHRMPGCTSQQEYATGVEARQDTNHCCREDAVGEVERSNQPNTFYHLRQVWAHDHVDIFYYHVITHPHTTCQRVIGGRRGTPV